MCITSAQAVLVQLHTPGLQPCHPRAASMPGIGHSMSAPCVQAVEFEHARLSKGTTAPNCSVAERPENTQLNR